MRLDTLIENLKRYPANIPVWLNGDEVISLCSWRGSYDELTIDTKNHHTEVPLTVGELLDQCNEAIAGKVFFGYKGGEFTMKPTTTVYGDPWGRVEYNEIIGFCYYDGKLQIVTVREDY